MLVPGHHHGASPLCGSQPQAFLPSVSGKAHDASSPGRQAVKTDADAGQNVRPTSYILP